MFVNLKQNRFFSFWLLSILLVLLFNFSLMLWANSFTREELDWIAANPILQIGTVEEGPPFFFENSKGELTGLAVKVVEELTKTSGLKFEFVFYKTVDEVMQSSVDFIFGLSENYQKEGFQLTDAILEAETYLFYRKGVDPTDLNNKRMAIRMGNIAPSNVDESLLVVVDNRADALQYVEEGKADYGYGNSYSIAYYNMKEKYENLVITPIDGAKRTYSLATKIDAPFYQVSVLNKAIGKLDTLRLQSIIMGVTSEAFGTYSFEHFMQNNWRLVAFASNTVIILLFATAFYIYVINGRLKREVFIAQKREEEIRYLNYYDVLSDLPNRRFYEEALITLDSVKNLPLSVIIGDLNGLKISNDAFGHEEGDNLIKRAARILKTNCPEDSYVFRIGGDEFVMFLPMHSEKQVAELLVHLEEQCELDTDGKIPLKISLGYATKEKETQSLFGTIKLAEDMMYKEKMRTSQKIKNGIIAQLIEHMFEKGIETKENIQLTKELACALAGELDLTEEQTKELLMLIDIHDIGKIAVSEEILFKDGALNPVELAEMHKHVEVGYRIADASNIYAPVARYILTIREHYDGSGYPQGLKGEEIPLISRIFQIVDAYVQMTSNRSYKEAIPLKDAKSELLSFSGKRYDPKLLSSFLTLI